MAGKTKSRAKKSAKRTRRTKSKAGTVDADGVKRDKSGRFAKGTARPPNSGWKTDSRAGFRDLLAVFGAHAAELVESDEALSYMRDLWTNGGRLGRMEVLKFQQRFLLRAMDRIPAGVDPDLDIGFGPARVVPPAGIQDPSGTVAGA